MNQPLVSVIIPVYNVEKYLRQCLDSIINQTLKDIEIICVDDGSTDSSLTILQEYKEKDSRIKVLQQQNQYAGVARNNGLKIAKGKYLSFLDSDDFFELNMLEEMYNKAEKDQSDIVICGWKSYHNVFGKVNRTFKIKAKYIAASPFSPKQFPTELFDISKPNPWTKMFRHQFFIDNGLYFEDCICCNDLTCICTAMAVAKKISVMNKEYIYYRNGQSNNITANRNKNFDSVLYALDKLEKKLKELDLYITFKQTFRSKAISSFNFGKDFPEKDILARKMLSPELCQFLNVNINAMRKRNHNKNKYF